MNTTVTQKSFLLNSKDKSWLIGYLAEALQLAGVVNKQHDADTGHLIVSRALSIGEQTRRPVVLVDTDTDLLAMLVSQAY